VLLSAIFLGAMLVVFSPFGHLVLVSPEAIPRRVYTHQVLMPLYRAGKAF
jgi:hypothetical protein